MYVGAPQHRLGAAAGLSNDRCGGASESGPGLLALSVRELLGDA